MQRLGFTRSAHRADHLLLTPDTFVRAPLPGMTNATAIVHAAPALGAAFTQYTAEFESGGTLGPASGQRFLYVLEGEVTAGGRTLAAKDYAYLPSGAAAPVTAPGKARATVIEKLYQPLIGKSEPAILTGRESEIAPNFLLDDPAIEVRCLLPDDFAFDFAVNTMTYQPGATLPMVEIHVMEHGLLMLAGGGIYRLGDNWYAVTEGDFIWMGPYCPQWFGALGKVPAKYLIYKDWNRHPRGTPASREPIRPAPARRPATLPATLPSPASRPATATRPAPASRPAPGSRPAPARRPATVRDRSR